MSPWRNIDFTRLFSQLMRKARMSHQKVTSKFPTAERLALSSRQQDPPHPNKPPREGRPFLLASPPKPRRPKPLIDSRWQGTADRRIRLLIALHRGAVTLRARGTAARM